MPRQSRRTPLALVALAASAFAPPADGQAQGHAVRGGLPDASSVEIRFPVGASSVELPFELEANKILVEATLSGSKPLRFVLDTGAPATVVLQPDKLAGVPLDYYGQAHVAGAGGATAPLPARLARGASLALGPLRLEGVGLVVLPGPHHAEQDAVSWDGILGGPVFTRLVVEVDWQRRRLRLHEPDSFRRPVGALQLPLDSRGGHAFVSCEVTVDGRSGPARLVVDTGAAHALALRSDLLGLPKRRLAGATLGRGLGGLIQGEVGRVDELRCGGALLRGVVAGFPEASSAGRVAVGADGNLGAEVLRRYDVAFDFAGGRMLLTPTTAVSEPFAFTTSGLQLQPWVAADGSLGVDGVYAGSPAERAGLRAGDRLLSVDTQPVRELGIDAARARLSQTPGTRVLIRIAREGATRDVALELAEIL